MKAAGKAPGDAARHPRPSAPGVRILQRQCSTCGAIAMPGHGSCETCRKKRLALQTKIRIGQDGDRFEREADSVADRILSGRADVADDAPLAIQRLPAGAAGPDTAPPLVESVLATPGQPLPGSDRSFFESRFGHDFRRVRIHVDDRAAAAVNAHAFTIGSDIVFASGQYAPATSRGRRLLAHELTHVVQQGNAKAEYSLLQRQPSPPQRRGRVLSLSQIAADPKREKARKLSGQTSAKVCRSVSDGAGKKNCPATLDAGMEVTIVRSKAGGAWLQVATAEQVPGFGPKEPLYVVAAFIEEVAKPADAPTPAVDDLDAEPTVEPTTADEDKQRAAEAERVKAAQAELDDALAKARAGKQQADSLVSGADQVDLDLLDIVHAQGEGVEETIELMAELGPVFAGLSDDQRKTLLGLAYLEMQMYAQNAQHAYVLNRNVKLDIPDDVTNLEEVEEQLDEFADFHSAWIVQNSFVGDLAADFFSLAAGLEESIQVNMAAAKELVGYEDNLKEENEALVKINAEMENFEKQTSWMRTKKKIAFVGELLMKLRGRFRRPSRSGKRPRRAAKPRKKPARTRKSFRRSKGQTKPKNPKQRKKKDKKKKERKGVYPICWPTLLGPPEIRGVIHIFPYVRAASTERDESAAAQERMARLRGKDPVAKTMHLHHIIPLFLGGRDADPSNLTLVPWKNHLTGHSWLAHQPQMARPPKGLKAMPENLYKHPPLTTYRLAGFKSSRTDTCR